MLLYVDAGEGEHELVTAYLLNDRHALFIRGGTVWITRIVVKKGLFYEDPDCGGLILGRTGEKTDASALSTLWALADKLRRTTALDFIAGPLMDTRLDVEFDLV